MLSDLKAKLSLNHKDRDDMASLALAGKVALVTGGSKGIGKATVLGLAKAGAKVAINYGRDADAAQEVVKQIGEKQAFAVQADAGSITGVQKIVKSTIDVFGKIDVLIANAGVLPMKDLEHTTEEDFDKTFALNVKGPYFLVQAAAPHMVAGSQVILLSTTVNFASTVAPPYLLYCATKGAIDQMVRLMSKDLARKDISVNAVAPGPTGTELFFKGKSEEMLKGIAAANPHNRIGTPEEVADAIVLLSNPGSHWISGQTIKVNGGMA